MATADDHDIGHAEITDQPDWKTTFPPHCMRGTPGQRKIAATTLRNPLLFEPVPLDPAEVAAAVRAHRGDILLNKPGTDVFRWNPNAADVLDALAPEQIIVYGVATDFCTRAAVTGSRAAPRRRSSSSSPTPSAASTTRASSALLEMAAAGHMLTTRRSSSRDAVGRFFIPGPVEIDPEVAAGDAAPDDRPPRARCARTGRAAATGASGAVGTTRPVMMATGSATAMMEAAVRSGVREQVLCIVSGTFGERLADMAERCGKDVVRLHVPRGGVLEPELLDRCWTDRRSTPSPWSTRRLRLARSHRSTH